MHVIATATGQQARPSFLIIVATEVTELRQQCSMRRPGLGPLQRAPGNMAEVSTTLLRYSISLKIRVHRDCKVEYSGHPVTWLLKYAEPPSPLAVL